MRLETIDTLIRLHSWKVQCEQFNQTFLLEIIDKWIADLLEIERKAAS